MSASHSTLPSTTRDIDIGEVIVNGILFDPKNSEALRTMDLQNLRDAVPRLFDLLDERQIEFVLVGGIALLVYVEGRNTQDIDLIVAPAALDELAEIEIEDRNPEFAVARFDGLKIDFLLTHNSLFANVLKGHAAPRRFAGRDVPCATVEGLLLLKLFALPSLYRQGQFDRVRIYEGDVAGLLDHHEVNLEEIITELGRHLLDSDLAEVRKIVDEVLAQSARAKLRFSDGA